MQVGNGSPFPFSLFEGEKGAHVVAFSCGERAEEGLGKGEVPPNTFLTALGNGRDLCAMLGAMNFGLLRNKSCRTGELQVKGAFRRELADGRGVRLRRRRIQAVNIACDRVHSVTSEHGSRR